MRDFSTLRFWCQKVLPLVYEDSLSYYEVLCKCVDYINKLVEDEKAMQSEIVELKQYVDDYFNSLDIQAEVESVIDELITDGTMGALVDSAVAGKLYQRTMTLERAGRFIDRFGYNNTNRVLRGQSCTYSGSSYYTCGSYNSNANQTICKWSATGSLEAQAEYTELGHANDITYYDGYLYVATGTNIKKINATTLVIDSTIDISGISPVSSITNNGKKLLIFGNTTNSHGNGVYSYDVETGVEELVIDDLRVANQTRQAVCYYDGKIYVLYTWGNQLYEYDLTTGDITFTYNIPQDDGFFRVMEVEAPLIVNGRLYISSVGFGLSSGVTYDAAIVQLFNTDVIGRLEKTFKYDYQTYSHPQYITVNGSADYAFNPEVTYTTIEEAMLVVPERGVRILNLEAGCYYRCGGDINLVRTSGTVSLNIVRGFSCDVYLDNITVDTLTCEDCNVVAKQCTINRAILRRTLVTGFLTNILTYGTIDRATVNLKHPGVDDFDPDGAPSDYTTFEYTNECGILTTNTFETVYNNHLALFANYGTTQHRMQFVIESSGGLSIPVAIKSNIAGFVAGVTKYCGGYTIVINDEGVISVTDSDNNDVTISSIYDFKVSVN